MGTGRQLTPEEEEILSRKLEQWIRSDLFPGPGTEAQDLLSSPAKAGVLAASPVLAAAAGVGALFPGNDLANMSKGALAGLPLAILAGLVAAEKRKSKNQDIIDIIRRYPQGAVVTKRDIDSPKLAAQRILFGKGNLSTDWR